MMRPEKKFYNHPSLSAVSVVVLTALLAVPTTVVLTARADVALIFGNPTNLGPMVNSSVYTYEWDPHISPDGLELYFLLEWDRPDGSYEDGIWMTTRKTKDEPWSTQVNLGPKVNSSALENGPDISSDGLELYFSTRIDTADRPGFGSHDIWVTTRKSKGDPWGTPVNLGPTVNSSALEGGPSISPDGLSLYFNSERPGGFGHRDIWVTTRKTKDDPWGTPVNLGPTVNSSGIENNPDISSDGSTLYFVSGRPGNVGSPGYVDIWKTSLKAQGAKE